jgi:hypothetical protein
MGDLYHSAIGQVVDDAHGHDESSRHDRDKSDTTHFDEKQIAKEYTSKVFDKVVDGGH